MRKDFCKKYHFKKFHTSKIGTEVFYEFVNVNKTAEEEILIALS
jgi:hypothetical protein